MGTIEDKARWYQKEGDGDGTSATAFEAGAEWMQSEMKAYYEAEIAKYKQDLDESRERENIACKAVAEKRKEIARLTRWNDPKEELPEYAEVVEVKYKALGKIMISTVCRLGDGNSWYIDGTDRCINPLSIIGWREIHE